MTLLRAFLSVSALTFLSRALGLVRDVVVAAVFGAGFVADAFFAAFRLPNLLRRFTAEGALTQAFVPVYNGEREADPDRARRLANETAGLLGGALLIVTIVGMLAAPVVVAVVAPGLVDDSGLAAGLLRVVFPYLFFVSLVALAAGILNSLGKFGAPAFAPVLLNVAMITCALFLAPLLREESQIYALAWGVFAGGALQLALMIFTLHKNRAGVRPTLTLPPSAPARRVLKMMGQSALGAGAAQINLLINLAIASLLAEGAISWLYYADRLMELPAGLLGAALATVVLPALSRQAGDLSRFSETMDRALRLIVFLAAPSAVGLVLFAGPIVSAIFFRGAFSESDAAMTSRAVAAYGIGVVGLTATRPLAAGFFARRDAATPVKIAVVSLVSAQAMNGVFILGFGLAHVGLALSVGLAACLNAGLLLAVLLRRKWFVPRPGWGKFFAQTVAALAALAGILLAMNPDGSFWLESDSGIRAAATAGGVGVAAGIYFAVAAIFGVRISHFRARIG